MNKTTLYPKAVNPELVGTYPSSTKSGGGYVWDEVLEYRVWCHPEHGAEDHFEGDDYFYPFENYEEALEFSQKNKGTEKPLVLILQKEHINEPEPGKYEHITEERITEWCVEWLTRAKRTERTIPDFMEAEGQPNRLAILRGSNNGV